MTTSQAMRAAILERREKAAEDPGLEKRRRGRPRKDSDLRPELPVTLPVTRVAGVLRRNMPTGEQVGALSDRVRLVEASTALREALIRGRTMRRRLLAQTYPDDFSDDAGREWLAGRAADLFEHALHQRDFPAALEALQYLGQLTGHIDPPASAAGGNSMTFNLASVVQRLDAEQEQGEALMIEANGQARDPAARSDLTRLAGG